MPWRETDVMTERIRFVVEAQQARCTMTALCRRYGISRRTGYKWLHRFREVGSLGELREHSRRPHHSPGRTCESIESRVVGLRERYGWGARKLHRLMLDEGYDLSRSTVDRILRRRGLVREKGVHRAAVKRFERSTPNELLQMDFKGPFAVQGGVCHPLSVLDDHSRYALGLVALPSQHGVGVERSLRRIFEHYGLPDSMLVDHGTPWWSSTNGHGLTRLGVFLLRQGVSLVYSGVGHPQTQGKVERFHRTMEDWFRHHGQPHSLEGFQRAFGSFLEEYNEVRPHEALEDRVSSSRYRASPRAYQPHPRPWEYPPGSEVRRVSEGGILRLAGRQLFVCHALAGHRVRCKRFGDRVLVLYRQMAIREIDLQTGRSRTVFEPYGPTGH